MGSAVSIYKGWKPHHAYRPEPLQESNNAPAPALSAALHLRKAKPIDTLLPRTAAWIASLPPHCRPKAMKAQYARILNRLAAVWNSPEECRAYFDDLLIDRRGGRMGFPVHVLRDLQCLERAHHVLYPSIGNVWRV